MPSTNTQFKQFLNSLDEPEVIEIQLGINPPPLLSDVNVGQFFHLVAIYVSMVLAFVYTAGYIVGYNVKVLINTTYNIGYRLGTFVHQLNDVLTEYVTIYLPTNQPKELNL